MKDEEKTEIHDKFSSHVNMSKAELKAWLDDETSMNTGLAAEDGEPKGHKSGRQILEILGKGDKLEEEDYKHMKQVNAYCARHLKQGNSKDPEHSKWRYSLMNWGCDPLKKPFGDNDKVVNAGQVGASSNGKASSPAKGKKEEEAKEKSPAKGEKAKSPEKSPEKKEAPKSPAKGKKAEETGDKRKPDEKAEGDEAKKAKK